MADSDSPQPRQATPAPLQGPHGKGRLLLFYSLLAVILMFQAYAYSWRLTLSLGPRVILQPWLMARGILIYDQIADMHTPLMPLLLSWLQPLNAGDSLGIARLVLVALVSLTTLLLFLASKREGGWPMGLWAVFFFACWSPWFEFGKLWYESFLAPLVLSFLLISSPSADRSRLKSYFFFGFLGGIAVLIKQHALLMVVALLAWRLLAGPETRRSPKQATLEVLRTAAGALLPLLAFCLYHLLHGGTLQAAWYWVAKFSLAGSYAQQAARLPNPSEARVLLLAFLFLPLAILVKFRLRSRGDKCWCRFAWGLFLLGAASITAWPRFNLFHLQAALPILAWLYALALTRAGAAFGGRVSRHLRRVLYALLACFWMLIAGLGYGPALAASGSQQIQEYGDLDPPARHLNRLVGREDSVYVFPDGEPFANLYYLLQRPPPRELWSFHYPWYMTGETRARIMAMLTKEPPLWIVHQPGRWRIEETAPEIVAFIQANYLHRSRITWSGGIFDLYRLRDAAGRKCP